MKSATAALIMLLLLSGIAHSQMSMIEETHKQMIMNNFSARSLAFTQNLGQWNEKALYKADASGATFWFCPNEVAMVFSRNTDELIDDGMPQMPEGLANKFNHPQYKKESLAIHVKFIGSNDNCEIISADRLGYNCNYFIGNIPDKWQPDVPNYSSLTYKDLYQGVDLVYHGNGQGMKYDFIVHPGADINSIKIKYEGAENLSISSNGDLEAVTSFGPVHENIPEIYQEIDGNRATISGRYIIRDNGAYGFEIDEYNPSYPLVIDPELVYSTYLGGINSDWGYDIAVDGTGNAYVTGYTWSADFPTQNPYYGALHGMSDVYVTKLSPSGNSLVYSTYLGGSDQDEGYGIAVDGSGNAYVSGQTESGNFPTQNPYQGTLPDLLAAFVTKLSPSGNSLVFSTYLGGITSDGGRGIAVDGSGHAYVMGFTYSNGFPTQNPYQGTLHGRSDVFVTKFFPSGNSLVYSTYLGGSDYDYGYGIVVDSSGNAYVTGLTDSDNFPTQNPYQGTFQGIGDAFVTKLSPSGNSLVYSTYLGGSDFDESDGIAVDGSGNAYVAGYTWSTDFPTQNPYQGTFQGGEYDAFVTKLSPLGNSLVYSTYLGGSDYEKGDGITVDGSGNAYVMGYTSSDDFPTQNPYQEALQGGGSDAFVTKLSSLGNSLVYSTYLGGSGSEYGNCIAIDGSGNAYVTGNTDSDDFPTQNPYQGTHGSSWDAFVAKFGPQSLPPPNDNCQDIIPIPLSSWDTLHITGNNIGATNDCDLPWTQPQVWHAFTTTECLDIDVSACGNSIKLDNGLDRLIEACPCSVYFPQLQGGRLCPDSNWIVHYRWIPPGTWYLPVFYQPELGPQGDYALEVSAKPCQANHEDFCDGSFYSNGDRDWLDLISSDRQAVQGGIDSWVVDDVTFTNDVTINRFVWTSLANYFYQFPGLADVIILANDGPGGSPGTVLVDSMNLSCNWGFVSEYQYGDLVTFYSIDNRSISLDAGTYWIGMRPVHEDTTYENFAATAPLSGSEMYFKSSSYGYSNWIPASTLLGGQHNFAFCLFGEGVGCNYIPGDINGNGSVNGVDIVYAVSYLKGGNPPPINCNPPCINEPDPFYAAGDVNGNCAFNGIDITYFVRYLKLQVPSLLYCSDCPPASLIPQAPAIEPIRPPNLSAPVKSKAIGSE